MAKSYPYKGRFRIKYPFGVPDSGYASGYHCGIDLIGLEDTNIYAINDGKIVYISTNDSYGNHVVQSLPDGRFAYYSHLSDISVVVGEQVRGGASRIGVQGSTGKSTGSHLDLRISKFYYHTDSLANFASPAEYLGFPNEDEYVVEGGISMATTNDPDIYLVVRVRVSKADALIPQIISMGYACKKLNITGSQEGIDPDIYLTVRARTSKADALIKKIISMGYACEKLDLA